VTRELTIYVTLNHDHLHMPHDLMALGSLFPRAGFVGAAAE